ncbi:hypothetical protein [Alkalicoccus saliphilus]|uniref:Uncharacterized protein n=1 Tax=Alkalicoccus saliphilus TaxID=200989 RepID=A0A2T4U2K9_9BACI|nr:hypothetical protein [Alkalicoccus saliphilus]PTL37642.1 hypothetical protein C6Y45_15375 [Alkalicoccus saliphilus]
MTTSKKKPVVSTDMRKVKKLLKDIPEDRQPIAQGIYKELVFMQNTLEFLKEQVESEGAVSMFKQGRQEFLREHPALKAYNATIQRYSLLYKQLVDLLPKTDAEQHSDPLMDFIKA